MTFSPSTWRSLLAVVSALVVLPACKEDSYAVVSVLTSSGSVAGVAQFRVHVGNGSDVDTLLYPKQPTESLVLDTTHPVTFSVQFSASRGGQATFALEALDVNGATLGYGRSESVIAKGKVFRATVFIEIGAVRPQAEIDAGALACDPYQPALACGTGRTCGLLCNPGEPAIGMCYAAGAGQPGTVCDKNDDCLPGSQCFAFQATGCSVMTCLRFCNHDDSACGEQGAFCNLPIPCGNTTPDFLACSRPCDPTGTGTAGCVPGLACFVYDNETTDCACAGLGGMGATCTQNQGCNGESGCVGCQAGLSCVIPASADAGGAGVCRPICNLAAPACPAGTTCNAFTGSTRNLYGFCQ